MLKNANKALKPQGIELRDPEDFGSLRSSIFDKTKESIIQKFPHSYGGVRMEVENVDYENPKDFDIKTQKDALLKNRFLSWRLRGTLKLYDEASNKLLDKKKITLMRVPYITDRGTTIHNGNEYVTLTQARLLPGVYTRKRTTGEVEAHFNPRRGSGNTFRVRLEPETQLYKMAIGQASLRLYSLLHDLGVSDEDLEKRWGPEILEANKKAYDSRVFDKAYLRLVKNPDASLPKESKAKAIKEALGQSKFDSSVISRTLPNLMNRKIASTWLVKSAMMGGLNPGQFPKLDKPQPLLLGQNPMTNPQLEGAPVADSSEAYVKFEQKKQEQEAKEQEAQMKHRMEIDALRGKMPSPGPDRNAIEKSLLQGQLGLRKAKEKADTDRIKADIKRDTDARQEKIKEESEKHLGATQLVFDRVKELKDQRKQLQKDHQDHEQKKRDLHFKLEQKREAQRAKQEMQSELDEIKMLDQDQQDYMSMGEQQPADMGVKYANTKKPGIKVLASGQMVNVDRLYDLLSEGDIEEVPMEDITGYGTRSKRDRFGSKRYEKADPDSFGIIDENNVIIDGKHRYFKNKDLGNTKQKFKRALPEHIQKAYAEGELPDYKTSQKQNF
tara:strand:+ start:1465 stop:3297 length:1833 start_codon:yes stop_codon:yes gene_type:complete